jgi:hypothetical protein
MEGRKAKGKILMETLQKALDDFLDALALAYPDGGELTEEQQIKVLTHIAKVAEILKLKILE